MSRAHVVMGLALSAGTPETQIMNAEEEVRAVEGVVDRLAAMYPAVSRERVVTIVNEEHLRLAGNPIRDFIPVLVEHESRERLRAEGARRTPFVETTNAAESPGA